MITINKYTIYDIAQKANVSIATVSRVLNNKPNVALDTRQRIVEIFKETHYIPNAAARGLVLNTSQTVGILTFNIKVPHYAATAYAIERELFKRNINAILCNTAASRRPISTISVCLRARVSTVSSVSAPSLPTRLLTAPYCRIL